MSILAQSGLKSYVTTSLGALIPQPPTVLYRPGRHDRLTAGPLWAEERFPVLFRTWESARRSSASDRDAFMQVCQAAADAQTFKCDTTANEMLFGPADALSHELRAYLWCLLFHFTHETLLDVKPEVQIRPFMMANVLLHLATTYRLTVVTFNYECLAESTIASIIDRDPLTHPTNAVARWLTPSDRDFVVLRPHGSAMHQTIVPLVSGWWHASEPADSVVSHNSGHSFCWSTPPCGCSFFPDIVPPGHNLRALANPLTDVGKAVSMALRDADAIVLVGFSADEPDRPEFAQYLSEASTETPAIHVGLDGDQDNVAGRLLRHGGRPYVFVESNQEALREVPGWLAANVARRSRPQGLFECLVEMTRGYVPTTAVKTWCESGYVE